MTGEISLQERYFPQLTCFGCGAANERGLKLKSYVHPDGIVHAEFTPWPEHDNGSGYLNGGIIATLLDCHSAAAVTNVAFENGWRPLPGAEVPFVTSGLDVRYLRPAPLDAAVNLVGEVVAASESEMTAQVRLEWDGKERATGSALWKRWRPR